VNHPIFQDVRISVPAREAYTGCARIARREARNFYFAFLPLRRDRRQALYAVYSFARLADDLADDESRGISERLERLGELEARLEESLIGQPRGAIFIALADAVERFNIPQTALHDLVAGVRQDQTVRRFATYEELCDYCYLVAGTVGLICAAIFEASGEGSDQFAVAQGLGMQLVNIMRDVEEDARSDRIYLPADLLNQYGVSETDILDSQTGEAWRALMEDVASRAREALQEGGRLLPLIADDAGICPALLRNLYEAILERIESRDYDVFKADLGLSFPAKFGILASAWWRYRVMG
jgi:phytoene synthase